MSLRPFPEQRDQSLGLFKSLLRFIPLSSVQKAVKPVTEA
jgi:hypothetical protein